MKQIPLSIILSSMIFSGTAFAKTLELYDNPKNDSKKIGTINSETGFVPIFKSKDKKWLKVGDPTNGNVGWLKSNDIKADSKNTYTFSEKVIMHDQGPSSYIVKFGESYEISDEKIKAYFKEIQKRQNEIQQDMMKMMGDSLEYFNKFATDFPTMNPAKTEPQLPSEKKSSNQAEEKNKSL